MECPYCSHNLSEFWGDYGAIYAWHTCPNCQNSIWLMYEEFYDEETNDEWGAWYFLTEEKY